MSGEHGQPLGGLPAPVRRSLLAVLVVAVAVASDACDASVGDAAALAAAVKRAGSDACVGRTSVVAVTADIALAAPVHVWANASVSLVGPHAISGAGDQEPKPRVECARCPVEIDPYSRQPCAYAKNGTWRSWDVSSDVAVVGSTFVGNEANFSAGGLGVTGGVRMTLEDTSFHRNSARISVLRP